MEQVNGAGCFQKKGRLIVVSAPSGCGKTTIVEKWLARRPRLKRSVSYTTRSPRSGERRALDYYFITRRDFLRKRKQGFFLEWANVFGQFYGTSEAACFDFVSKGFDLVLIIDVQGMRKVVRKFRHKIPIVTVFIKPPSMADLRRRLQKRKTDAKLEIEKRLRIAKKEIASAGEYDYTIINRTVEQSVKAIDRILKAR